MQPKLLSILNCFSVLSFASFLNKYSIPVVWSGVAIGFYYQISDCTSRRLKPQFTGKVTGFHICGTECVTFSLRSGEKKFKRLCVSCGRNSLLRTKGEIKIHINVIYIRSLLRRLAMLLFGYSNRVWGLNVTWTAGLFLKYSREYRVFDTDMHCPVLHNWRYLKSPQATAVHAWEEPNVGRIFSWLFNAVDCMLHRYIVAC